MSFIATVDAEEATGETRNLYDQTSERFGFVPNLARAFSHRPKVWQAWTSLQASITSSMDLRRYELVTLAAAQELRSSYCMLAHGSVLLREFFSSDELKAIVSQGDGVPLDETDKAIMAFARKVVRDATSITEDDVDALKSAGLSDGEVFDVVAAAALRCFFSKTLDALGVQPDAAFNQLDDGLRQALTIGRPIE